VVLIKDVAAATKRGNAWRAGLLALCLFAVGAVHLLSLAHWHGSVVSVAAVGASASDSAPDGGSHSDCALCQLSSAGGASVLPSASAIPVVSGELLLPVSVAFHNAPEVSSPSYAWHSRGPPRV
jgi:hypothetical protein